MTKSTPIELDERLNIARAGELHRSLAAILQAGGPVVVDGSRVEEIDTAILQLLVSLWRTGADRGIACTWAGTSDALLRTANLIGVSKMLHFADLEPAGGRGDAAT